MTTKERWTVYPLLVLAIGLALRGELVERPRPQGDTISVDAVVCRELAIVGEAGVSGGPAPIIVHAGRVKGGGGGRIELRDAEGVDAIAIGTTAESREGGIEFFDSQARRLWKLGPTRAPPAGPPNDPAK